MADDSYYEKGKKLYYQQKSTIHRTLRSFTGSDGSLNASKMQSSWFPQIKSDVFISHSHKDEKIAISLAGWLHQEMGLMPFIDSCVWGCSSELLNIIDKNFCLNPGGRTYNYNKRNNSTSHIHMMLSTALSMMIDKTECIFFLNTPNSIIPNDIENTNTFSPWIYFEIAVTQFIQKKEPEQHRSQVMIKKSEQAIAELRLKYNLDLSHLMDIDLEVLDDWASKISDKEHPLDALYRIPHLTE